MKALITGASSGIGEAIADELLSRGYDIVVSSRTEGEISALRNKYPDREIVFLPHDLSKEEECYSLLSETENMDIDLFVSNSGCGGIGKVEDIPIEKEVEIVKLNDIATLILSKEMLKRFISKNKGRVMFLGSSAAWGPAPYMNVYYSSKVFVYYLAQGYHRELKDRKSKVTVSVLCPGPVKTEFEKRAGLQFTVPGQDRHIVARRAVKAFLKGKLVIVPSISMKLARFFSHFVPKRAISKLLNKSAAFVK